MEWILRNQLGRRNLTDFQRNRIALKYESVISERMKKRMSEGGGDRKSEKKKIGYVQMVNPDFKPTSKRAELAKIAGTSQGSIQRTKLILNKGTSEQIKRAEKGGKIYSPVFGRKDMDKYPEPSREPTTTRKELAKIAGVGA